MAIYNFQNQMEIHQNPDQFLSDGTPTFNKDIFTTVGKKIAKTTVGFQ